jgi:hypothetical protein
MRVWTTVRVVLTVLHLPRSVVAEPLTKALYAEIESGARDSSVVTSIPPMEFSGYEGDITLGPMPALQSVGFFAFSLMAGQLTINAGDCNALISFGERAFFQAGNASSVFFGALPALQSVAAYAFSNMAGSVTIGAMPALQSVADFAFQEMTGQLTINAGDCNDFITFGANAFTNAGNAASFVTFGALPALQLVGDRAFKQMTGQLTINTGDCNDFITFGANAFANAGNAASSVTFGALPALEVVGAEAFKQMTGQLTINSGICNVLLIIGVGAFQGASNAASYVSFRSLINLHTIQSLAFKKYKGVLVLVFDPDITNIDAKLTTVEKEYIEGSSVHASFNSASNTKSYVYLPQAVNSIPKLEAALANGFDGTIVLSNPLTKALYAEIKSGAKEANIVTSIPASEFENFSEIITLGPMPHLLSIESNAFWQMSGQLTINAGDCNALEIIAAGAFREAGNNASSITFGALPALKLVGEEAFTRMTGNLTITAGDCNTLQTIDADAFREAGNPSSSVTFGALPALQLVGDYGFYQMTGQITINAGDCNALKIIGANGFQRAGNAASSLTFDALPVLESFGVECFTHFEGTLSIDAGDCNALKTISASAFRAAGNAASSITLGALPFLQLVGEYGFYQMAGQIIINAGDCNHLIVISAHAFYDANNAESSITFGALPALQLIEEYGFYQMAGQITINTGDCNDLFKISAHAFYGAGNAASSITFGALPSLQLIGEYGFYQMAGQININAGDCNHLINISAHAFYGAGNAASSFSFGALPALEAVGRYGFYQVEGQITIRAGDCKNLTTFALGAFYLASHAESFVSFGSLVNLDEISSDAFREYKGVLILTFDRDITDNKLISVGDNVFDKASNSESYVYLPQEPNTIPLLEVALANGFNGTVATSTSIEPTTAATSTNTTTSSPTSSTSSSSTSTSSTSTTSSNTATSTSSSTSTSTSNSTSTSATTTTTLSVIDEVVSILAASADSDTTNETSSNAIINSIANAVKSAADKIANATPAVALALVNTGAIETVLASVAAVSNALKGGNEDDPTLSADSDGVAEQELTESLEDFLVRLVAKSLASGANSTANGTTSSEAVTSHTGAEELVSMAWKTAPDFPRVGMHFELDCATVSMNTFGDRVLAVVQELDGVNREAIVGDPTVSCGSIQVVITVESTEVAIVIKQHIADGNLAVFDVAAILDVAETTADVGGNAPQTITVDVETVSATVPVLIDPNAGQDALVIIIYPYTPTTEALFPDFFSAASSDELAAKNVLSSSVVSISLGSSAGSKSSKPNLLGDVAITLELNADGEYEQWMAEKDADETTVAKLLSCVWWDYNLEHEAVASADAHPPGMGGWNQDGCILASVAVNDANTTVATCSCTHLTHFAVLFSNRGHITPAQSAALKHISFIGVGFGTIGIIMSLSTFAAYSTLVGRPEHIIINLCIATLLAILIFAIGADRKEGQSDGSCTAVGGMLHYFLLATWTWQLCEGQHLYETFVVVMGLKERHFGWYMLFGWGGPLLFVVPSMIAYHDDYAGYTTPSGTDLCWINPASNAVYLYIVPAMVGLSVNIVICGVVLRSISSAAVNAKSRVKAILAFGTTLGLVYVFGAVLMIRGSFAIEVLFCLGLVLQGLLIFYFHVFRKEDFHARIARTFSSIGKSSHHHHGVNLSAAHGHGRHHKSREHPSHPTVDAAGSEHAPSEHYYPAVTLRTPAAQVQGVLQDLPTTFN